MSVLIETTVGDLVVDLFVKERPNCSLNFLKLCKIKYYNFSQFHSIEQNYVAQTGKPFGSHSGGESVFGLLYGDQATFFAREDLPKMRHRRKGIVSMVNNGDDLLGSQFFITLADDLDYLDDKHTIFGQVTEGLETLDKLNEQICDESNKPFRDIRHVSFRFFYFYSRIAHTIILEDPFPDPPQLKIPSRSPSPTLDLISHGQIALDEAVDEDEGKNAEEIAKEIQEREKRSHAQILEMVGDLHHADEAPPDNVLFVCKLNPVTTDDDLEIIFARFGKIERCEVIRDRRTGISLQYAFIEFESPESCEVAYKKMDNVLIDDRRIHVDFSQSVAKNYTWDRQKRSGAREEAHSDRPRPAHTDKDSGRRQERRREREREDSRERKRKRERSPRDDRSPRRHRDERRDRTHYSHSSHHNRRHHS